MRNDEAFEFDPGPRGSSQYPAVLIAVAAIAAILIVNSTALAPLTAASTSAPAAAVPSLQSSIPASESARRIDRETARLGDV